MKIVINYESSWRNSFLDGSNDEPLPKQGREFIASMTNLNKDESFIVRDVSHNTVMEILNRLIGDQRKLYQARNNIFENDYYFEHLENKISFKDLPTYTNEVVYIRNLRGSTDQNSFTGLIKTNDPIFLSKYSSQFWGFLWLDFTKLCQFIINDNKVDTQNELDPITIISQLELLDKDKLVENVELVLKAYNVLKKHFPDTEYLNNKGLIKPIMFYCSALYLQLERLICLQLKLKRVESVEYLNVDLQKKIL